MEEENKLKSKVIKTYTDEMVKALGSDKGGLIKKIIHEEEEFEEEKKNLSPSSQKNKWFMIIGAILIFLALSVVVFFVFFDERINVLSVTTPVSPVIFLDQTSFKAIDDLNKEKIAQIVLDKVNNTKVKIGGVEGIYLTEDDKVVGLERFNKLIKGNLTSEQIELIDDSFLFGIFKSGTSSISPNAGDLFILLKVKSFTDIFSEMKNWEKKMLTDLYQFFGVDLSAETNYLFTKDFEDGIISNKNARILKDNEGKTVLMYVFTNDDSIIITDSEATVNEIILRLNSSQIKK